MQFAFYGRVSTEDHQDEAASRGWQRRRAEQLISPYGGIITTEFFDVGQSRSLPWARRPQANLLMGELRNSTRGWGAIVVGEPARAFYGNQFSLTFPVIDHYGVELWVPEVGGRVDPGSEAHEMLMSVFGGMSKGERTRIKVRVQAAMSDLAEREGRFLGGRPPYGYRIADVGPHPNPEKAAAGLQLHQLEPDPTTAPVVQRIFAMYLAGAGFRTIATHLAEDAIPSPSAYDQQRNAHRSGRGWAFTAVRAILENERYMGHQVWGRQPRHESLLDPNSPQDGHVTTQRWAPNEQWLRSSQVVHQPLVDDLTFRRVQAMIASKGRDEKRSDRHPKANTSYLLAGRVICALCGRKMSGHKVSGNRLGYQCRIRADYALPSTDSHPKTVWVTEKALRAVTFDWLSEVFAPENEARVMAQIAAASTQPNLELASATQDLKEAETRIARLAEAVENGTFAIEEIAERLRQHRERRDRAKAVIAAAQETPGRLDPEAINELFSRLGGLVALADRLTIAEQRAIFEAAELRIHFDPTIRQAAFGVDLGRGVSVRVGGPRRTQRPRPCSERNCRWRSQGDGTGPVRATSSNHWPVSRTYTFRLTVDVEEDHEAYDDPEWVADAAWGALRNLYGLECIYTDLELVIGSSSSPT
jgi:site-specific DNA recombinase